MNIEHLRYMLEVSRVGSISQAAENLYMAQPNLSKAIKELEQTLNIIIFKRTSKGVQLTPNGQEFLRYAKDILRQYENMEALGQKDSRETHSLRISVPRASYIVDAFTTLLTKTDSDKPLQMDFFETNALRTIQQVSDEISDLGIIRCKAEYQNYFIGLLSDGSLMWHSLLAFEYLLLVSKDHPLAHEAAINGQDLQPFIEIIHGDTAIPHMPERFTETERGITPGSKKIKVYERGSQFDILTRVPDTYMWVSPMPQDLLVRNGLIQKRCVQSPQFIDMLIHRAGHTFSDLENQFVDLLNASADQILQSETLQ